MSTKKRLVLFVEGQGDEAAVQVLVRALLTDSQAWDCLFLDPDCFRVGEPSKLAGKHSGNWTKKLQAAANRKHLGGVLLLLDGDATNVAGRPFCAASLGREMARQALTVGGGTLFSVACVFALLEFESWLIAGVESLAGRALPDGRPGIPAGETAPKGNIEQAPRDAKRWLSQRLPGGYKPTRDQALLTRLVDAQAIRARGLRSFQRLENALKQLVEAIRTGKHIVTPTPPE